MLGVLVERAWDIEDLFVLLIIVALGTRFINHGDDVVCPVAAILTRLRSFWPITAAVTMVNVVIIAEVVVASIIGVVVVVACWAMRTHILVEAHLGFLGVGGHDHLANSCGRLAVELGAKLAVMESSDDGGDDLRFRNVRNRILSKKRLM